MCVHSLRVWIRAILYTSSFSTVLACGWKSSDARAAAVPAQMGRWSVVLISTRDAPWRRAFFLAFGGNFETTRRGTKAAKPLVLLNTVGRTVRIAQRRENRRTNKRGLHHAHTPSRRTDNATPATPLTPPTTRRAYDTPLEPPCPPFAAAVFSTSTRVEVLLHLRIFY